jgi:hypothetical protein
MTILAIVAAIPAYAAIGTLVCVRITPWCSEGDYEPLEIIGGVCWPLVLPVLVLVVWPVRLALRLPGWLERRRGPENRSGTALPRARTVRR